MTKIMLLYELSLLHYGYKKFDRTQIFLKIFVHLIFLIRKMLPLSLNKNENNYGNNFNVLRIDYIHVLW